MIKPDPALDIVRDARKGISRAFDNDPKRLVEHYMKIQAQFADRMIGVEGVAEDASSDISSMEGRP